MPSDPYAVLRALLRAEAARRTPAATPEPRLKEPHRPEPGVHRPPAPGEPEHD
jgi:hypothetical protein